eukprot:m.52611 g.52611  ORF g.52611 m.52611 type:complete len:378 (-) comp13089_c0_seq4:379-1512(-)
MSLFARILRSPVAAAVVAGAALPHAMATMQRAAHAAPRDDSLEPSSAAAARHIDLPSKRTTLHSSWKPCQEASPARIAKAEGLLPEFSTKKLSKEDAKVIVETYWNAVAGYKLPRDVESKVLDAHVQGGQVEAGVLRESLQVLSRKADNVALLVIDVQNDFSQVAPTTGSLYVKGGEEIAARVNDLRKKHGFRMTVHSKDWHPADHSSFFDNWRKYPLDPKSALPQKPFDDVIFADGTKQKLWPVHCVQNSWGSQLDAALKRLLSDQIVYKGLDPKVDSYSAFADVKEGADTPLHEMLQRQKITHVVVVGLALDYCVQFTAKHAVARKYTTYVVEDLTRPVAESDRPKILAELREKGVVVIQAADVGRILAEAAAAQ